MTALPVTAADQLDAIGAWLPAALRRFGANGYGRSLDTTPTLESLAERIGGANRLFAGMVTGDAPGLVVVERSPWEEKVIGHPMARISFLGAETLASAVALLNAAVGVLRKEKVVLARAGSANAPGHIHAAYGSAGFYVGSEVLTLSADLNVVWPRLERLPECKDCRFGTPDDAEAMARVADGAFGDSRLMSDPHFPREWGNRIYMEWARTIARSDEHRMIVAEENGRIVGFANIQRDVTKAPGVPGLFAVRPDAQGAGIGPLILRRIIREYRDAKSDYPLIATEKSNAAINALYFRLGYRIENAHIVYHWTPRND